MSENRSALNKSGLIYLAIVYVVWGSTYLAIRVGVREGAGFTPFMMGTLRALTAGGILLAWAALKGQRLRLTRHEFLILAGSGLLLWVFGNGLVMVGEKRADSGLAALIVAGVPLWAAVMEAVIDRRMPSWQMILALLVGMAGLVVLSLPVLRSGVHADVLALVTLFVASICWAMGSVLQSRNKLAVAPTVSSGYQLLFGGIGFGAATLLLGEPIPHPTPAAWGALIYLIIFGSLVGFTSYVQILRLLPTRIATTYAYVNPVIAVFLGWIILSERLSVYTFAGAALVLLGVMGVFRVHKRETALEETEILPAD